MQYLPTPSNLVSCLHECPHLTVSLTFTVNYCRKEIISKCKEGDFRVSVRGEKYNQVRMDCVESFQEDEEIRKRSLQEDFLQLKEKVISNGKQSRELQSYVKCCKKKKKVWIHERQTLIRDGLRCVCVDINVCISRERERDKDIRIVLILLFCLDIFILSVKL